MFRQLFYKRKKKPKVLYFRKKEKDYYSSSISGVSPPIISALK